MKKKNFEATFFIKKRMRRRKGLFMGKKEEKFVHKMKLKNNFTASMMNKIKLKNVM